MTTKEDLSTAILQVLDAPTELRIIIVTHLPALCSNITDTIEELAYGEKISDTLYYMIDRSPDNGETASDMWVVSNSCGGAIEIPSHTLLLDFVEQITSHCPDAKIWVEGY